MTITGSSPDNKCTKVQKKLKNARKYCIFKKKFVPLRQILICESEK